MSINGESSPAGCHMRRQMQQDLSETYGQFVADYPRLRPAWWGLNGHVQTLASFFAAGPVSNRIPTRHIVPLSDGDRLVIHDDHAKSWITGDRIAILVHGLCGSHDSPHVRRIAMRLRRHGVRTIRIDMRGFGDSELISRGHLNAGCSQDLVDVIEFARRLSPLSKFSLIGFSLGANIVLKTLCDWGRPSPQRCRFGDCRCATDRFETLQYESAIPRQSIVRILFHESAHSSARQKTAKSTGLDGQWFESTARSARPFRRSVHGSGKRF